MQHLLKVKNGVGVRQENPEGEQSLPAKGMRQHHGKSGHRRSDAILESREEGGRIF